MRRALITIGFLLLAVPAAASEYVGLWKVDREGSGVDLSFPDNGFAGACVRFSGTGEEPGHVRIESQIVRHRFDSFAAVVDGGLDPLNVHVQATVKGKTVWTAPGFALKQLPLLIPLGGHEITLEAKKLDPGTGDWGISICGIELSNERFSLRFTSDCEGFDLEVGDSSLMIMADEDWYSLGWEMSGGMGVFDLERSLSAGPGSVSPINLSSFFPTQLFYAAFANNDKPLVELGEGETAQYEVQLPAAGELQFVVKAKTPMKGMSAWKASVRWDISTSKPETLPEACDDILAPQELESPSDTAGSDLAGSGPDKGCSYCMTPGSMASLFLLLTGALLALYRARRV